MDKIQLPGHLPILLKTLMPFAKLDKCNLYAEPLNIAIAKYGINTPTRLGMFLAQLAHESGSLHYDHEIWNNNPVQQRYERNINHAWPPTAKDPLNRTAFNLGNTEPGDGFKYRGRGPMQETGRSNYTMHTKATGHDFINNPDDAAIPLWGADFAGWFWNARGLNALADKGDYRAITKRINGGFTHFEDRVLHYVRICKVIDAKPLDKVLNRL